MTDPILEYKQKPLEGYGSSNENLINVIPHNDLFGRLGAMSQTPVPPNIQFPDLSKLLTQPKVSGPLSKLDVGYSNPTDNLWAKSTETLRQKNPDLFNPIHRVTSLPGSFIKEYTNTDSNYDNMFSRAMGQMAKGATVGGAVGATIGAGVSVPVGGIGAIPGWGVGAITGGVAGLLGLMETSGKQGFKFDTNNREETSQKQSGFLNSIGGFANNVVDRSFEASVGGTAALLSTPFGALAGKDFYNMGENTLSSHLADSLEESEFKMKASNNYLNSGPIAKFFTREGFSNDVADMVGFTVGMIAGTKMQGMANLGAGKLAGLGADALGYTETATKMSTVGLLRSPSGFLLGRNTTIANEAGLAATKGLSALATGKGLALTADELIPMFKTGLGRGTIQFGKNIINNGVKSAWGELSANYGTKLANLFKDGSVGLSYLKNFERTALASYGEARVEALQSYNDIYNAAIKQGDSPEKAIEKATEGANKTLFGNMVLLGATNQVALNNLIESPSRLKSLAKWFDDAWKYDGSTRNLLRNALTLKGDSLLKNVGRSFIIEGFAEELGQHALSEGSKNYVMNKNNPIHQSFLTEFGQAYKDGLSSDEGISNWFGGGLFGAAMGLGGGGMHLINDKKAAKKYSLEPSFLQRVSKFETATEFFANHMSPYDGQLYSTYTEKEVNGQKVYEEDLNGELRFVDDPTRIVKLYQALSHINRLGEDQSKVLTAPVISNLANLDENDPKFKEHKEAIDAIKEYFDYLDISEKIYAGQSDVFTSSKKEIEEQISEIDGHLENKSLDPVIESNLITSKEQLQEQLDNINQHLTKINSSKSMVEASKKEAPKSIADYAEANDFKKTSIMKGLQLLHNTAQELNDVFSFKHDLEPLYIDLVKTNHVADYVIRGVEEKLFAELDAFEKDLTTSDNLSFMGSTFKNKDEARSKIAEFKKSLEEQVDLYKKILFRYGNPVTTAILKNKDGKHFKRNVYVDTKALLRSAVTQRHLSDKYQKNEKLKEKIQLETILNNPTLYKKYLDPKFTYDDLLKDIDKGIFNVKTTANITDYLPEVKQKLRDIANDISKQETLLEENPNDPTIIAEIAKLQNEYDNVLNTNTKENQTIEVDDFKATKAITDPIEESFKQLKTYQKNQQDIQDMLTKENELYLRHTNIDWIVNQAQEHANTYEREATDTKTKAPEAKAEPSKKKDDTPVEKKPEPTEKPVVVTPEVITPEYKVGDTVFLKDDQEGDIKEFIGKDKVLLAMDHGDEEHLLSNISHKKEVPSDTVTVNDLEAKKADIERRRQGLNGIEKIIFSNPNFRIESFEIDGNYWNVVTSTDRAKVLVNINGVIVPFYLTTGQAGKGLVPGWYPFFGIGKDGWLNKTDKSDMETYYERYWGKETADIVKSISKELNSFYGTDPTTFKNDGDPNATSRPLTTLADKVEDYINSKLNYTPAINDANARKTLRSNVEQLGKEINAKYDAELKALEQQPTTQTQQDTNTEEEFVDDAGQEEAEFDEKTVKTDKDPQVRLTKENLYKAFGNEADTKSSLSHIAFRSFLSNPQGLTKFSNAKLFAIPLNHPIAQTIFDKDDKDWYAKNGLPIGGQVIYIYINGDKVISYNGKTFVESDITVNDLLTRTDLGDLSNIPYNKSIGYSINEIGQFTSEEELYNLLTKNYAKPKGMSDVIYGNYSSYIKFITDNGTLEDIKEHLAHINKLISIFNDPSIDIINKVSFLSLNITGIGKGVKHTDAKYTKLTPNGELLQSTTSRPLKENGKVLAKNAFYFKVGNNYHLTFRKTLASVFSQTENDPSNPFNKDHLHAVLTSILSPENEDGTDNPYFLHNDLRHYLKSLLGVSVLDYKGINFTEQIYLNENGKFDLSKVKYPDSPLYISPDTFKNNRFTFAIDGDMRILVYYGKNLMGFIQSVKKEEIAKFADNMLGEIVSKPIPINLARLNQGDISKQKGQGVVTEIKVPIIRDGKISSIPMKNGDVSINSIPVNYKKLLIDNEVVTYLPAEVVDKSGKTINSRINRYPLYSPNTFAETPVIESSPEVKTEDINELILQKKAQIKAATDPVEKNNLIDELKILKEKAEGGGINDNGFRVSFSKYSDIENIPEFITWLESVLPQFTVQTTSNKIDGIAQGQYVKNLIKIWEGAQSGTGFHEAFEAVWFNMLSPKEQSDLINEFKSREGSFKYFVDGRTINYSNATNLEAKEMIAEGFREYMLTGKQSKPKAQGFFKRLLDLLKSFINHVKAVFGSTSQATSFINDIYQKIADGEFKNFTINNYSKETGYRVDYGDDIMSFVMNGVMKSIHSNVMDNVRKNLSLNVYDIVESNNKKELSKQLEDIINTSFEKVTDSFAEYCAARPDNEYDVYYRLDEDGLVVFNPELKERLKQDYIDSYFKGTLLYDKSDYEEYAEEAKISREGIKEDTEIDPLSKVRPVISFILSNLRYIDNKGNFEKSASLQTVGKNGNVVERVFAYKTPNLDTVKSLLVSNLKDIVRHKRFVEITQDEYDENDATHRRRKDNAGVERYYKLQDFDLFTQYIAKIDEIIKRDPKRFSYLHDLKAQLKTDVDFNLLSEADKQLRVSFVASFNLTGFTPISYTISSMGNDINDIMYDEAANKMIGNWKLYAKLILEQSLASKKSPLFVEEENPFAEYDRDILFSENREVFIDLNKFRAYYSSKNGTDKDKVVVLQSIGIIFSEEGIYDDADMLQNVKLSEEVDGIINILMAGDTQTISLDTFFKDYVGTSLRTLASNVGNIEGAANLSFLGPNNEMQYTAINPSTESHIINKLNSITHWDELVHNFEFMFKKDGNLKPGLQNNLFLKKGGLLFDESGIRNTNKFERILVSGLKDRDKNTGEKFSTASILSQRVVSINALLDGIFSGGINADKSMENAYKLIGKSSKLTEGLLSHAEVLAIKNYMVNDNVSSVLPMYKAQVVDEIFSYFNKDHNIKTIKDLDGLLVFKDRLPTLHKMIVDKAIISPNDAKIEDYFNDKGKFGFEKELTRYLNVKNNELILELIDTRKNIFKYTTKFSLDTLINIFPNIKTVYDKNGNKSIEDNIYFDDMGGNVFQLSQTGLQCMARLINGLNDLVVNDFVKMKSGDFSALKADDHPKRANAPTSSKIGRDLSKNVLDTLDEILPATVGKHRASLNYISLQDTIVASANLTNRMEKLYKLSSQILKDSYGNPMPDDKIFKMLGATFTNGKLTSSLNIEGSVYHTYHQLDMADAQAWCLPKLYANLFFSSGMLSQEKKKQLQYEMAVERQERSVHEDPELRYVYTDDKLKTMDENILLNEKLYNTGAILEVVKPFGYGFHRDSNLVAGSLLKNSMALLTWNRVKNNPSLAKQYVTWQNADIDLIGHTSGQKQGVVFLNSKGGLHPLFNEDGTRNTTVPNGYIQSMEGEHFGFQVEMHDHLKEESTLGSQLSNIIIGDLKQFINDKSNTFLSKEDKKRITKNIKDYLDVQRGLVFTGRQKALDKLGLKVVYKDGKPSEYISDNPEQLAKTLEESAKTLKVTINTMDLFKLKEGKFQYFFETAPKSDSIEFILNSIIDKAAIHQKVKGTQAPQVSSEMIRNEANWKDFVYVDNNGIYSHFKSEKAFKAYKGNKTQTSNSLKLREDGTLEVMMPSYMKGKVDIGTLDKRLLEFVGYRIPTQSLGQVEAIEVVGFLDDTWGNAIVVPAEIVGKAGSDFDIDKLNMYMPHFSVTTDEDGNNVYSYIEYDEDPSEEGILRRYNIYTNKFNKVSKFLNHLDNIIANDYQKNVLNLKSTPSIDKLMDDIFQNLNDDISPYNDKTIDELLKEKKFSLDLYNKTQEKYNNLKGKYMSYDIFKTLPIYAQNTREQLENRNIQLIRSLTLEPINQLRHLMPNGSKNLKEISNQINKGKDVIKTNFSDLFTFIGRTRARYTVINAKALVGMGATNIPTHCISQNGYVFLNGENTGSKILERMTTDKGIALYNILDENGYLISSTLSEFLSAFVDGAKDPFIMDLNVTNETVSRLLLLIRLGVTPEVALRFINQPILKEYAIVLQNSKDLTNKYMQRKYDLRSLSKEHKSIYNFFMDNMDIIKSLKTDEESLTNEFYQNVQLFLTSAETIQNGGTKDDIVNGVYQRNDKAVYNAFEDIQQSLNSFYIEEGTKKKIYTGKGMLGTLKDKTNEFWKLLSLKYDTNPKSMFNLATLEKYGNNPKSQIETMKYLQFQVGLLYEFKDLNKTAMLLGEVNSIFNAHSKTTKTLRENQVLLSKMRELRDKDIQASASIFNIRQALHNSNQESIYQMREDTFAMLAQSGYLLTASPAFVQFIEEKMKDPALEFMSSGDLTKYMSTYSNFALSYMIHKYSSFNDKIEEMKTYMFKKSLVSKVNALKSKKRLYSKFKHVFDNLSFSTSEINADTLINNISLYNPKQTVDNRNEEIIKYEDAYKIANQMLLDPLNASQKKYAEDMLNMLQLLCNFSIYQHGLLNTMASFQDTLPSGLYSKTINTHLNEISHLFFIKEMDKNLLLQDKPIIDKLLAQNFYYNGIFVKYSNISLTKGGQGKYITSYFQGAMTLFEEVDQMDEAYADMLAQSDPEDDAFDTLMKYKYQPINILGNRGKYIVFTDDNNPSSRRNTALIKGRSFISNEYDEDDLAAREQALVGSSTQESTAVDDDLIAREEAMQSIQNTDFEIVDDFIEPEIVPEEIPLTFKIDDEVVIKETGEFGNIKEFLEDNKVLLVMDFGNEVYNISDIDLPSPKEDNNPDDKSGDKDAECPFKINKK